QEAELKEAVARAASGTPPPESAAWHGFKEQLQTLYRQQALLNRKVVELAKSFQNDPQAAMLPPPEEVSATLKLYGDKLEQDLLFPERLLEFKAEIADRLGLALQDTGRWEEAARSFGEAYDLNQALGRTANLAAKKRAVAYALYMAAGQVSGRRHDELLTRAKGEFEKALALVGQYGVAARPEPKKEGLINIALAVELDKSDVTQAAHGFSAQQEIRLDEAFLMRINLEQGQIEAAWQALAGQIAQYPEGKEVATRDTFGVSLLFHRAGQLAVARNALSEAFDLFARSANLCLDLGTPVSAMVNLRNLASLLTRMEQPLSADRFGELIDLDGRTARLLAAKAGQMPDRNQATFHNDLGCGYLSLALAPQESLTGQALAMEAGRRAMAHFSRGLDLLGAKAAAPSRELLALTASLNYNLGRLCQHLGEKVQAETRLDQAATLARQGLLADIGWRALAALGRYDEALAELRRMTFTRARAGKGEVVAAFMQRVMELAANNKAEAGFNLLAELAEIERFQRLAPLVFTLSREEERAILDLLPRLRNIADLKREAETAKGPDKPYLEEKLGLEMTILKGQHQELVTLLPAMVRNRLGTAMAEDLLLLIGSALEGERLANEAVAASPEAAKPLHSRYLSLVDQYQRMQERLATTQEGKTLAALFGPEPVEAMEVMEAMAEGECLLQMVETGSAGARYLAFAVGRESLTAKPVNGVAEARPQNCSAPVLVADDPALFREIPADSFSFSTSQFLRSVASKKPFTKKLLVLHSGEEAPKALAAQAKDLEAVFAPLSADPAAPPSRANLLLLADQVGSLYQVPTRGGESGRFQPGIRTEAGGQLPLDRALAEAGNLTAAILPNAAATDAYEAANLLTLSGVPTILLPLVAGAAPEMVPAILNTIRNESPAMALAAAAPAHDPQKSWLVLGYRGMDAMEAQELGRQQFTD
ncbi:MAG: hypothetical protein OEV91_09455, partial [Desulfobulbaceae bacterium]|nr:hypothetical protein [Desulfobulbaceae bacterium]